MNQYVINNGVLECRFSGKLDTLNSQAIDTELKQQLSSEATEVTFDLREVDYISSSFLRICLSTLRQIGKDKFRVIHVSPTALKVFQIANLNDILQLS
jgi:anti-anti-sigma factor